MGPAAEVACDGGGMVVPSLAHTMMGAPYEAPLASTDPDYVLHVPATDIDKKDADTPDAWVPRDPRIQRLTGRHPLNCEPPMDVLMAAGFITPPSLHYVRNHGPAPRGNWGSHRVNIGGPGVRTPLALTMDEIVAMPSVRIPVTLVCAGNRRKEENMIKKSIGFNWGPCAVSTSYWTGVRLRDLLLAAGVKTPEEGAHHVCFRGPKGELPKGSDGSYGTSVTLQKAMDPASDVIVVYKQNDRWLTPDHGFPVRIIIPGFIGGRMIKWLEDITVTEVESDNFYHFMDNRVLPSHVDEEIANKEGWWFKPDFIINNLNINSAVAKPWHDEVVSLASNAPYTVKGYAYAGGGARIIRVEISLDDGVSWRLADIKRFEKPNAYGKHWCWVHWDIEVKTFDFLGPKELLLRAWDEDMNTQPAVITWNVMGMMNNSYFRIKIHPFRDEVTQQIGLRFQHPAPLQEGQHGGIGWREEENLRQAALKAAGLVPGFAAAPVVAAVAAPVAGERTFTMDEVEKHSSEESAWFVHEGAVYDATPFLGDHPGGADSILIVAGMDATEDFNAIHSSKAKAMLKDYYLGRLVDSKPAEEASAATASASAVPGEPVSTSTSGVELVTLSREKVTLKLAQRTDVSHNTRLFRFALPTDAHRLGLPVGKHVFVYASMEGESVMRAYTPTSSDSDLGHMDLLVKVYFPGTLANGKANPGGKMSQHLESLKVGDTIQVKGPVGHFHYKGRGEYMMGKTAGVAKHLSMVAGGTGITPVYAVMKAILSDAEDPTTMSLIFANQTADDMLMRAELDSLAAANPDRLKVYYVLSQAHAGWEGGSGYVTLDMMKERLFPAQPDTLALMCGPPGLLDNVCVPFFEAMGYTKETRVLF
ncbi:hypothetical protein FOA52_001872 [Chlamydomonas sp. UWO 241]|nr:hypothetical protein FOA52_001872 [Chlamydomonas sp. UWO 241]